MSNARAENLCRSLGWIRRRRNLIIEGRDSNFLSTETVQIQIKKIGLLRLDPRCKIPWQKGEDYQSNFGEANNITCTRIVFKEKTK
jgi:hypothetical protein